MRKLRGATGGGKPNYLTPLRLDTDDWLDDEDEFDEDEDEADEGDTYEAKKGEGDRSNARRSSSLWDRMFKKRRNELQ